jgi:multiple sugar transport system ATP-binding protein
MSEVRLVDVGKRYEGSTAERPALEKLNLTIPSGELAVLVGPSGCGKSTTLRIVAGLESPTAGRVYIDDREVTHVPPSQRDIAMVFQSYALYPHMTVFDNMSFALRIRKMPSAEIREKVTAVARSLGIEEYLDRRPKALSGGQRQRVAIGRAVVRDPKVFLFDEPLSNLDAKLRGEMRREIARIHHESHATSLYVTHDQVEAMTLADRIVVLRDGDIQQVGSPIDIYDTPANQFVAGFFGTPAMNFLPAIAAGIEKDNLVVGVRPEAIALDERPGATSLAAAVEQREVLGAEVLLHLSSDAGQLTVRTDSHAPARRGDNVTVWLDSANVHLFDATSEQRLESGTAL